jgi:hypothetical protein
LACLHCEEPYFRQPKIKAWKDVRRHGPTINAILY